MTEQTSTPEKQNSPEAPDSEETRPNPAGVTGFFNRLRKELQPTDEKPVHPTEAAEIVIMEEDE